MNTSKPRGQSVPKGVLVAQDFDNAQLFANDIIDLIFAVCEDAGSTLSWRVRNCLHYADYDHLLAVCDINPTGYADWKSYLLDAQIVGLIKKYPHWKTSTDPKLAAAKTFISCENKCAEINDFIWSGGLNQLPAVPGILFRAQKKISEILGSAPSLEGLSFEFGPGAAYSVKKNTNALDKLGSTLDVTLNCYGQAGRYLQTCPGWRPNKDFDLIGPMPRRRLNVVLGDRLAFVPKTALTDRPIAIGPLVNVVIQKGLGEAIRHRLRRVYDLDKRQVVHRRLAQTASRNGELATVDLSNASDTISYGIVLDLLPPDWFELLDRCRSPAYEIDGKSFFYHKFSAMGNGYTFELETLLFYALAVACCDELGLDSEVVTVYGDDIIIPTSAYTLLTEVLAAVGFTVNTRKSFCEGPFRESCGGDFFNGVDVRPFFLKDHLTFRTLFLFHNYLVKTGYQFVFKRAYRCVKRLIGNQNLHFWRTWNPLDDGALLDYSMCRGSYNTIVSFNKGRRRNPLQQSFGVSYLLYRIGLSDKQSRTDVDWNTYKSASYRLTFRRYRYVHF